MAIPFYEFADVCALSLDVSPSNVDVCLLSIDVSSNPVLMTSTNHAYLCVFLC